MGQTISETVKQEATFNNEEVAHVYRVRAGAKRWYVFQEPESVPVAAFDDKASALNYAMCLARGRVAWHLLLRQDGTGAESTARANGPAHH